MPGAIYNLARTFLRAYVVDGQPGSGVNAPNKTDGLAAFAAADAALATLAIFSAVGVAYPTLALLQANTGADAGTPGLVFDDPTSANDGIYAASGSPAVWTLTPLTLPAGWAAMVAQLQGAAPWRAATWTQLAQLKAALVADGAFDAVLNAIDADPTNPATQQWDGGGVVTSGGPLATLIQETLGWSAAETTALFAAAQLLAY